MAVQILPTRTDGLQRYSFRVTLEGVNYGFEFTWSVREAAWYFLLSDANKAPLLSRKVVVGYPLTGQFKGSALPAGELLALDTTGADLDPGLTELGSRVLLCYVEAASLP